MFTPLISNFSYRSPSLKSFHGSMPRGCTSSSNCFLGQCPLPTSMVENNLSSREQSLCRRCRVNLQLFPWQIIFCGRRPFRGYLVVTFTKIVDHLITMKLSGGFLVVSPTFTDSVYPRLVKYTGYRDLIWNVEWFSLSEMQILSSKREKLRRKEIDAKA